MRLTPRRAAALAAALTTLGACSLGRVRPLRPAEASIVHNAIFVANDGAPLRPRTDGPSVRMDAAAYAAYLRAMADSIRADTASVRDGVRRIVVRVHGGLNRLNSSLQRTVAMREAMREDAAGAFFPIFVNWESGLRSAYLEHLFVVRRGQRRPREWFWFPFYAVADVGGAVVRAPLTWGRQFANALRDGTRNRLDGDVPVGDTPVGAGCDGSGVAVRRPEADVAAADAALRQAFAGAPPDLDVGAPGRTDALPRAHGDAIAITRFSYCRGVGEAVAHHGVSTLLTLALIKPAGGIVVDALGTPAWANMHRRTELMFRQASEFDAGTAAYAEPTGAAAGLLRMLGEVVADDARRGVRTDITLIGHSMGAIVASAMVQRADALPWTNVVFMGAATSGREVADRVFPYLERHPDAQLYSLTLHPWSERRERNAAWLAPNGSLLEWIDAFFANPETESDRMFGKYDNAVRTAFTVPPAVRGRVHVKAFGYRDGTGCGPSGTLPHKHGQFNDERVPFWRPGFWRPGAPGCEAIGRLAPATPR